MYIITGNGIKYSALETALAKKIYDPIVLKGIEYPSNRACTFTINFDTVDGRNVLTVTINNGNENDEKSFCIIVDWKDPSAIRELLFKVNAWAVVCSYTTLGLFREEPHDVKIMGTPEGIVISMA